MEAAADQLERTTHRRGQGIAAGDGGQVGEERRVEDGDLRQPGRARRELVHDREGRGIVQRGQGDAAASIAARTRSSIRQGRR
jgi:hypothetical protein